MDLMEYIMNDLVRVNYAVSSIAMMKSHQKAESEETKAGGSSSDV